jgi:hypothetical protein
VINTNWVLIILNEANAENTSASDLKGLEQLTHCCMRGDVVSVEAMTNDPRPHVRSAASFILRRHKFETARLAANDNKTWLEVGGATC